ncbi:hypothetical protein FRC20_002879 [Serendipita sp. 405]|nr:hypothetical protein FRC20_002879 [Serendipita sp. 405]
MSGGVDSSVTASILARSEKSLDLSAIFMRNWDTRDESGTEKGCEWEKDWEDVQRVCKLLDIPCRMIDLSREYWNRVFQPALEVWSHGQTPNPDVSCNRQVERPWIILFTIQCLHCREIKFGALLDTLKLQDGWLATGHYARLERSRASNSDTGHSDVDRVKLLRGVDPVKDQSYWLSSVSEAQIRRALFPIGHLSKGDVRKLAVDAGLPTASRRESMGICFVGKKRSFSSFLDGYLPPNPGTIVTLDGEVIARHQGLWHYTIGQNARISGRPKRMFVAAKRPEKNQLIVVDDRHHPELARLMIRVTGFRWIWDEHPPPEAFQAEGMPISVKFRSVMQPIPSVLRVRDRNKGEISFMDAQYGISPGQTAVVYLGAWCLGSGTIVE